MVGFLGEFVGQVPLGASGADDFGNAIYDLSQGSAANRLLSEVASEPVGVHAVTVTRPGEEGAYILSLIEEGLKVLVNPLALGDPILFPLLPGLSKYCPNFGPQTSDLVVPSASQRYGATFHSPFDTVWHSEVPSAPEIGIGISGGLLFDRLGADLVRRFDPAFPASPPWPLNCE
jgi:hypothetical protein